MRYKILIADEAETEIIQAKNWYEKQQPGLGFNFSDTIKTTIEHLKDDTVDHRLVFGNIRRVIVKRFPYVIYYKRDSKSLTVKILAVLHYRQDQQQIRARS